MEATPRPPQRWPGSDIVFEARRRLEVYSADWRDGFRVRARILAPSTYIFLASLLPALAFGLQLDSDTEGVLGVVQVLAATAITGVVQAVVGGQPLLIVGVAEPVVLIYGFMYDWAEGQQGLGRGRFLAWAAWVCVWTAVMVLLLAASGACRWVGAFTRFSGELFGGLIGVLFLQQAIKGLIAQFRLDPNASHSGEESAAADAYVWRLVNGLWSLLLAAGLLLGALAVVRARSWRFLSKPLRGLLADYGAPACVLVCTGVSFAVSPQAHGAAPPGVPRRVSTGDVWSGSSIDGSSSSSGWRVAARMGEVPGTYIAAALLPAFVIAVLFYFDHSVSSLMAQQPEYRLARPPAFALDLALLAAMTLGCGLMGLPPVNGVLPQAPMHTRSLATLGTRGVKGAAGRQPGPAADEDEVERRHSSGVEPAAAPTANGNSNSAVNGVVNGAITAAMHFPTAAVELAAASARLRPRRHPPAAAPAAVAASGGGGGGVGSVGGVITDVAAGGVRQPSTRVDGPHLGPPPGAALPAALASRPPSHLAQQPSPPAASAAAALRPQRLGSSGSGQGGQGAACAGQAGCRLGWQGAAGEGAEGGDGGAGDAGQPAAAAARRRLLNGRTSTEDAAAEQEAYRGEAAVGRGTGARHAMADAACDAAEDGTWVAAPRSSAATGTDTAFGDDAYASTHDTGVGPDGDAAAAVGATPRVGAGALDKQGSVKARVAAVEQRAGGAHTSTEKAAEAAAAAAEAAAAGASGRQQRAAKNASANGNSSANANAANGAAGAAAVAAAAAAAPAGGRNAAKNKKNAKGASAATATAAGATPSSPPKGSMSRSPSNASLTGAGAAAGGLATRGSAGGAGGGLSRSPSNASLTGAAAGGLGARASGGGLSRSPSNASLTGATRTGSSALQPFLPASSTEVAEARRRAAEAEATAKREALRAAAAAGAGSGSTGGAPPGAASGMPLRSKSGGSSGGSSQINMATGPAEAAPAPVTTAAAASVAAAAPGGRSSSGGSGARGGSARTSADACMVAPPLTAEALEQLVEAGSDDAALLAAAAAAAAAGMPGVSGAGAPLAAGEGGVEAAGPEALRELWTLRARVWAQEAKLSVLVKELSSKNAALEAKDRERTDMAARLSGVLQKLQVIQSSQQVAAQGQQQHQQWAQGQEPAQGQQVAAAAQQQLQQQADENAELLEQLRQLQEHGVSAGEPQTQTQPQAQAHQASLAEAGRSTGPSLDFSMRLPSEVAHRLTRVDGGSHAPSTLSEVLEQDEVSSVQGSASRRWSGGSGGGGGQQSPPLRDGAGTGSGAGTGPRGSQEEVQPAAAAEAAAETAPQAPAPSAAVVQQRSLLRLATQASGGVVPGVRIDDSAVLGAVAAARGGALGGGASAGAAAPAHSSSHGRRRGGVLGVLLQVVPTIACVALLLRDPTVRAGLAVLRRGGSGRRGAEPAGADASANEAAAAAAAPAPAVTKAVRQPAAATAVAAAATAAAAAKPVAVAAAPKAVVPSRQTRAERRAVAQAAAAAKAAECAAAKVAAKDAALVAKARSVQVDDSEVRRFLRKVAQSPSEEDDDSFQSRASRQCKATWCKIIRPPPPEVVYY